MQFYLEQDAWVRDVRSGDYRAWLDKNYRQR